MWEEIGREKPFQRREHARLFGVVAHMQREQMAPYLAKTITAVVKRLRDGDVLVREAAAESMGKMARYVPAGNEAVSHLSAFFKPLFQALTVFLAPTPT